MASAGFAVQAFDFTHPHRRRAMKAKRITIKRVNQKTYSLPSETKNRFIILFRTREGGVTERKEFFNHPTCLSQSVAGYSHYIVLPNHLYP